MARKHFDTLWIHGSLFNVSRPSDTPTSHSSATFRLRSMGRPSRMSLDLWTGFGGGSKHAGDATPSTDPREAVPASDPTRSGRATRDGWQPVAVLDTDSRSAVFVTRSVNDEEFVSHVAATLHGEGWDVEAPFYVVTLAGAVVQRTTLSRTGVPHNPATFRNTEANTATHRERARQNFNALMEHGRRQQGS